MNRLRPVLAIVAATAWISISEFVRNSFLVHSYWTSHYTNLGYVFPEEPVNGALWGLWSLLFALAIFLISRKSSFAITFAVSWIVGFAMMWVVIGNLGVLPLGILPVAVPLSILEALLATFIILKIAPVKVDINV
jgi:hypothetical protein